LASHFLLQEPRHLEQLLGPQWWDLYQRDQLQNEELMLFPCLGQAIFTDSIFSARDDQVYWLGPDSLALARCAPRRQGRSLDLCTGSGVQAVLNATRSGQALAVDLNPRAVKFCQLNAAWNGHQIETFLGDLYQPLPPGKFTLITANPPFVPTPREDALQLFRPGGESGEEVTAAIVGSLPEWLEVGGMLALVSQCPDIQGSDPLERMHSWLGYQRGWGLAQLRLDYLPRENLIAGHVTSPQQFERWWDCYEAQGILGTHLTVSFVLRLEPERPAWKAYRQRPMPGYCCWSQVEAWLQQCDQQAT
jgi:hypothetical protein